MNRTYLILDGLEDPALGRLLSARWSQAGFANAVDVAGQCGWIAKPEAALTEPEVDRAAAIARGVGLEIRDRVGSTFRADNDLAALRKQMVYEYKSRLATALVFVLPALALHYAGPVLAGGGREPRALVYPWLFELLLVGWACLAAGWPILWQGALALRRLRMTADLFTSLLVAVGLGGSTAGMATLAVTDRPWVIGRSGPMFHAAALVLTLALLQRWLVHRAAPRLSGRVMMMLAGFGRLLGLWLMLSMVAGALLGWPRGLALAMLLPPMLSIGGINRWSPGWSIALPLFGFAVVMLTGSGWIGRDAAGVEMEIAAGFQLMMIAAMALGWRGWQAGV